MARGNRDTSHWNGRLRVAVVLLLLTLLVVFSGCALRNARNGGNPDGQPAITQQTPSSQGGSNSAAQQVQSADQQVQNAMQGLNAAGNDADAANNQAGQEGNTVP